MGDELLLWEWWLRCEILLPGDNFLRDLVVIPNMVSLSDVVCSTSPSSLSSSSEDETKSTKFCSFSFSDVETSSVS